jgi:Flp pilus assembly pilin Flp
LRGRGEAVTIVLASVRQFLRDDDAQDLVEYALLGLFVGVVGVVVWNNIVTLLGDRYTEYNTNVQDLWVPPDP